MLLQGRYQLRERLGAGGMGVVWRGFDHDLEEWVAIKFLHEEFADDEALQAKFRREVRLARRVTHANVARVHEFGREGGLCFLTMEYIPGESLQAQLLREGALAAAQVYAQAVGLCRGLGAAHAAGVVHGDLKPSNILLAPGRGAVLTDFGLARGLCEGHTGEDLGCGTPVYMAPEQFAGEPMTPRSDVYATGVLLFEALTGRLPWPADDVLSLLAEKSSGRALDLAACAPELSAPWRTLLTACMHNEPGQRPQDGRALLTRLAARGPGDAVGHGLATRSPGDAVGHGVATPAVLPLDPARPRWLELAASTPAELGEATQRWGTGQRGETLP